MLKARARYDWSDGHWVSPLSPDQWLGLQIAFALMGGW